MNGKNMSERFVEVPWCLSRYYGEDSVLDVGCSHADNEYLVALADLAIPNLYGLDLAPPHPFLVRDRTGGTHPLINHIQGDVRRSGIQDQSFDLVICISTLEHVGKDNSGYGLEVATADHYGGDLEAIVELYRITRPRGRLLLTVPFGKYEDHGWFQQYDIDRLIHLVGKSPWTVRELEFFGYTEGWHSCSPFLLADVGYGACGAPAAAGVACVNLQR